MFLFFLFPKRMRTRYPLDDTRGPGATPATALARLPRSARHQLWHLSTPLLRVLLLLSDWPQRGPLGPRRDSPRFGRST